MGNGHRVAYDLHNADLTIEDPGNAGRISVDRLPGFVNLVSAGVETRYLANPSRSGQQVTLCCPANSVYLAYNSDLETLVLDTADEAVTFLAINDGTSFKWKPIIGAASDATAAFEGIADLTAITAADIDDDAVVEFGVIQGTDAKSLTLAELKKTGVQVYNVKQYGATGDGVADDTAEIQAAIDAAYAANGGIVYFPSGEYLITAALEIGTGVGIVGDGQNNSIITQATSDVSIVAITKAATNYFWKIKGIRLSYDTQQTSAETSAFGIQLSEANTNSYLGTIEDVQIQQAYQGISLPNVVGCTAFLIRMSNVHARSCADYGFYLVGASTGARTNIVLTECWVEQVAGSEVSTSKGFHIAYTDGFRMSNCGCDHIQEQRALYILSSNGTIGTFWAESCDITASTSKSLIDINGSIVHIGSLYSAYNTVNLSGSADYSLLRAQSTSNVTVGHLIDKYTEMTDTSSGAYYTVQASSSDIVSVGDFQYIAGSSPANNGNLADFGTVKYIRTWDNNERTSVRGGKIHTYGTAAPVSGTWSVGDVVWNTAPAEGNRIGWTCTSAGTPGTWAEFASIAGDKVSVEASTAGSGAPNVLAASESSKALTNEGTTAANYHTLPTAVAGLTFTFVVQDADGMRITAATGDTIRLGNKVTATAGYIESTTIGDYVTLTAINATEWLGLAYGTWTDGTFTYTVVTST